MKNIIKLCTVFTLLSFVLIGCGEDVGKMKENYDLIADSYESNGYIITSGSGDFTSTTDFTSESEFTSEFVMDGFSEKYICSEKNGNSLEIDGKEVSGETITENVESGGGTTEVNVSEEDIVNGETTITDGDVEESYMSADSMCEGAPIAEEVYYMLEYIDSLGFFDEEKDLEVEKDGDYQVIKDGNNTLKISTDGKELVFIADNYTTTLKLK